MSFDIPWTSAASVLRLESVCSIDCKKNVLIVNTHADSAILGAHTHARWVLSWGTDTLGTQLQWVENLVFHENYSKGLYVKDRL